MIRMIMMGIMRRFIAGPAITELRPFQDARFFEQPHRAVDGGDGNARIDDDGPRMQRLDIGMIGGLAKHTRDDATLFGHSQALLVAKGFDLDHLSHERNSGTVADKNKPTPHTSRAGRRRQYVSRATSAST